MTGPNPVGRGKGGSKLHVLSEAGGIALAVGVSAANVHDSHALRPLVAGIPAVRSRRGPDRSGLASSALTCYKKLAKLTT